MPTDSGNGWKVGYIASAVAGAVVACGVLWGALSAFATDRVTIQEAKSHIAASKLLEERVKVTEEQLRIFAAGQESILKEIRIMNATLNQLLGREDGREERAYLRERAREKGLISNGQQASRESTPSPLQ